MSETTTVHLTDTVDTWLAAYTETDAARRAELIEQVWAPGGTLTDPPFTASGCAEITAVTGAAQGQFPAHSFRRTSEIDAHHDVARYTWELVGPDGTPAVAGMDVVALDANGRLLHVVGFFGEPAGR